MQENHAELKKKLQLGLNKLGFADPLPLENLWQYLLLMQKWNQVYNLTAIRTLDEMISQHILDSIAIIPYLTGTDFIDVGTGAGLPGIPLSIMLPQRNFTLLDSNSKKTAFLLEVKASLKLNNVQVVTARVEAHHQQYDGVLSRAFSALNDFVGSTKHLLKKNGHWCAMKGPQYEEETRALHDYAIEVKSLTIPYLSATRFLLIIKNLGGV
jgi:16S rRNA (guanine527-N7)-methyltransferase